DMTSAPLAEPALVEERAETRRSRH
ncbi:UNVERIFIED_CONTAM: hypothetical protein P3C85_04520, partial [Pseudomonas aeruginosa]